MLTPTSHESDWVINFGALFHLLLMVIFLVHTLLLMLGYVHGSSMWV